jgi:hypothetical protein
MSPQEKQELQQYLQLIGKILVKNTPEEQLQDFESIELAIREHLLTNVSPIIASIFLTKRQEQLLEKKEK